MSDNRATKAFGFGAILGVVFAVGMVAGMFAQSHAMKPEQGKWYWTTEEMLETHQDSPQQWVAVSFVNEKPQR